MKWYGLAALVVLSGGVALGQAPVRGAGSASASGGVNSGQPGADSSMSDSMRLKSNEEILRGNPRLAEKMKALLPADLAPAQACAGYKVLEQCVSAVHLAADLKIAFGDLQAATTGKHAAGLEKAAAQLAPAADARAAVKKARAEAGEDLKGISLFGY
jgi:hypothetical protein